ncbi:unnamed protein product [Caenorhabditis nigoni]
MSNWIQNMTKSRNVIIMIFAVFGFWTVFYSWTLVFYRVVWYPDVLDKTCDGYKEEFKTSKLHILVIPTKYTIYQFKQDNLDPFIKFIPTILYPILTIALLFQLRAIKKKRENVQKNSLSDRSDKTTKLILAMTVCLMLSEGLYGLDDLLLRIQAQKFSDPDAVVTVADEEWISLLETLSYICKNLVTINASTHPFFCFIMSSQYRDTVKAMFCKPQKKNSQQDAWDHYTKFVPTLLYPILTVALLFQLRAIKKKRENVQKNSLSDRSDKTTKLILAMTVCLMLSEGLSGLVGLLIQIKAAKLAEDYTEEEAEWVALLGSLSFICKNLVTFNASTHPFFCFIMSSQYRDTVKGMFCKAKKKKFTTIKVSSASVSSSSESSKTKSY